MEFYELRNTKRNLIHIDRIGRAKCCWLLGSEGSVQGKISEQVMKFKDAGTCVKN